MEGTVAPLHTSVGGVGVGVGATISFCPPSEQILDRWLDHAPESGYDTFGGENSGWIASGQTNSMAQSSSASPYAYSPAADSIIRIR
jgi:hypothetical protein